MANLDRDTVRAALRAEDVAAHLGIKGPWRGRWMRARRCARADHSSDAFGLARDGMWHCWSCDEGGDLFALIAAGEGLNIRDDFGKVLELAAAIAGVEDPDDFGGVMKPAPKARPEAPPLEPIAKRLELARKRAAWVWDRMQSRDIRATSRPPLSDLYLEKMRGLDARHTHTDALFVATREDYRDTPIICSREVMAKGGPDLEKLARMFAVPGIAVPVRSPIDGALVDIRVRRFEPREGQPKIVGMLGGVTSSPSDGGGRTLHGCYGFPHEIESDTVVVVEGMLDYLTALCAFPSWDVLGAVEAGTMGLVAGIAAKAVAGRDNGRVLIVEQNDPMRVDKASGDLVVGAGKSSIIDDPNSAAKTAIRILGPRRVGWLFCGSAGTKDLNDLYAKRVELGPLIAWWSDIGEPVAVGDFG